MFAITERLLLRPPWPEDAGDVFEAICDEAIVRNLGGAPWPYRPDDAEFYCNSENFDSGASLLIFDTTQHRPLLVGSCGYGVKDGCPDMDLGYWIRRSHWGRGIATEAGRAVRDMAIASGHSRLSAGHYLDNPASGRVLEKIGFRATGKIAYRYSKGRSATVPCVMFSLDADDDFETGNPQVANEARRTVAARAAA